MENKVHYRDRPILKEEDSVRHLKSYNWNGQDMQKRWRMAERPKVCYMVNYGFRRRGKPRIRGL